MEISEFRNLVYSKLEEKFDKADLIKGGYLEAQIKKTLTTAVIKHIESKSQEDARIDLLVKNLIYLAKNCMEYEQNKKAELISKSDPINTEILLKEIEPFVKETRKSLFNSESVPFINSEESETWIYEMTEDIDRERLQKNVETAVKIFSGESTNGKTFYEGKLFFKDRLGKIQSVASEYNNKLYILQKACKNISECTGFKEPDAVMYILNGSIPTFPRYVATLQMSGHTLPLCKPISRTWVTIKLNVSDIQSDEIKLIYDYYRETLNIKSQKPIRDKTKKIIDFVYKQDELPPPKGSKGSGTKGYWINVLNKWNALNPNMKYSRWESLMKAYDNAMKKKGVNSHGIHKYPR